MTRPGDRLRALAGRFCDPQTMERLIDPVIADLQCEHADALRHGRLWRSRWVCITGCVAFWKVAAIAVVAVRPRESVDDRTVWRTVSASLAATVLFIVVFILPPLLNNATRPSGALLWLIIYLVPQAMLVAMPFGVVFGILTGLRGGMATRQARWTIAVLTLASSLVMFVNSAWGIPTANQAFREAMFGGPVVRGMNELTLTALAARSATLFHLRVALAFAPLALGLFSLSVAARHWTRNAIGIGMTALSICGAYYMVLYNAQAAGIAGRIPGIVAGWAPNLAFLALTVALHLRTRGRSAAGPSRRDDGPRSEDRPVVPQA
jgi:hypothetical protein